MIEKYYLLDLERTIKSGVAHYWRANKQGYTSNLSEAGLYSKEIAFKIEKEDIDKRTVVISKSIVDNIL